jgi:hypothetical protein
MPDASGYHTYYLHTRVDVDFTYKDEVPGEVYPAGALHNVFFRADGKTLPVELIERYGIFGSSTLREGAVWRVVAPVMAGVPVIHSWELRQSMRLRYDIPIGGKGAIGSVEITAGQPHWWDAISRQVDEYPAAAAMPYGVTFTAVPEPGYGMLAVLAGLGCCLGYSLRAGRRHD